MHVLHVDTCVCVYSIDMCMCIQYTIHTMYPLSTRWQTLGGQVLKHERCYTCFVMAKGSKAKGHADVRLESVKF